MIPQKRKYFAILVHFDSETVFRSIKALWSGTEQPDGIIVVDHSPSSLKERLAGKNPGANVSIIRPQKNSGYFSGLNVGLGALYSHDISPNDIVICLNDDVIVEPDAIMNLKAWWQDHPEPALVGASVTEGGVSIPGIGHVNLFTGRAILEAGRGDLISQSCSLPYVHGAFFSAPYDFFLRLRGLPAQGFLYWEDVILSVKAAQLGLPLCVASSVRVSHRTASPAAPSPQRLYYLVRNGALFMEQYAPLPARLVWFVLNRARYIYHLIQPSHRLTAGALADAIRRRLKTFAPAPASLSAIIATHNSARTLSDCVESLKQEGVADIIVVDNASSDGTSELAKKLDVKIIPNNFNRGFGAACNQGAQAAQGNLFLFLNPDAQVKQGSLARLLSLFAFSDKIGAVGLLLLDSSGRPERDSFGSAVTPWSLLARHFYHRRLPANPSAVGFVSGGAFAVRAKAFKEAGRFDEQFFMYWEDVDLCRRLKKAGWQVFLDPAAQAIHNRGESLKDLSRKTFLYDQSADRYFRKHYAEPICFLQRLARRGYRLFSPLVR